MNKKLYHIELKNVIEIKKHFYYGDLLGLMKIHETGVSLSYLQKYDWVNDFENEICIIRKSELVVSTRSRK